MKQLLVALSATLLLALAGTAQALPLKDAAATDKTFASTAAAEEVSSNQPKALRQDASAVDSDTDAAPINPYALAAAGLVAVAFLARHRPIRD